MKNTGLPKSFRKIASARLPHKVILPGQTPALPTMVEIAVFAPTTAGQRGAIMVKIGNEPPFEVRNYRFIMGGTLQLFGQMLQDFEMNHWVDSLRAANINNTVDKDAHHYK